MSYIRMLAKIISTSARERRISRHLPSSPSSPSNHLSLRNYCGTTGETEKIGRHEERRKVYVDRRADIEMKTNTVVADAVEL